MNPSIPSGAVLDEGEWARVAELCGEHDLRLLYNAAMERILYDGHSYVHPAALPGMAERTVTVGSVSKEYRMIGWRVGWVVGPADVMPDIAKVAIYNVVTPVGLSQPGAAAALTTADDGVAAAVREWGRRRDVVLAELEGLPVIPAAGGWSLLLDVAALGLDSFTASEQLLAHGRVAATPMRHWGEVNGDGFIRLVFSNETPARLTGLGRRVRDSLRSGR